MGIPLGLGAFSLTPTLHIVDPKKRYQSLFGDDGFELGLVSAELAQKYCDGALQVFENYICKQLNYASFAQAPRIQQLLTMLSWPGPKPHKDKTRYMEIEREDPNAKRKKRNEYRDRPVLPDPLNL